jgi:hypothetical protein
LRRSAQATAITNVIMVAITIVLGLALWVHATGLSASSAGLVAAETNKAVLQQRSLLNIVHGYYVAGNGTIVLYLYNYGSVELALWRITVANGTAVLSLGPSDMPGSWGPSNLIQADTLTRIFIVLPPGFTRQAGAFTVAIDAIALSIYGGGSQPAANAQWGIRVEYTIAL